MEIWGWLSQNWFNAFSATGVIVGLWFTVFSLRADTKTQRIANLLTITANHREVWKRILLKPELKRVLDPNPDLKNHPLSEEEGVFVNMVILHTNSVFYALSDQLVVNYDGLRGDISDFFSLPIPKMVWEKSKTFQNSDFVTFVDSCIKS